jgi:hypothetical protein
LRDTYRTCLTEEVRPRATAKGDKGTIESWLF